MIIYDQYCNNCGDNDYYPCNKKNGFKHKDKCDKCESHDIYIFIEYDDE